MHAPDPTSAFGRRELVLVAALLVAMARLAQQPGAALVASLLAVVILIAGAGILGVDVAPTRAFSALLIPAVLAGGAAAAIQLVPPGLGLVPFLAGFAFLLDRTLVLEMRLLAQAGGATDADRARVLLAAVAAAFVAFTGVAALVPGGLAEPGGSGAATPAVMTEGWVVVLAAADALVAALLGYRLATFRYGTAKDAARSAVTYAIVVAVAAGAIRAVDLPRLVGPAVLTLVFYLWDALHGTAPARRREPRFLWETILLIALAAVVIAWNLRLRS
ncbi:MAG TPA: hypothetical protein VIK13_01970 [Candidatus Limnocylindrales bacterium]